jgi:hypothetical protein
LLLVWKLAHVSGFSLLAASADEQAETYATVLPLWQSPSPERRLLAFAARSQALESARRR